jgi:hypothetical protein
MGGVIGAGGAVDDEVAVGPAGDAGDDSGRGDPFGVERATVVPLPLHHNGVEVPEHADVFRGRIILVFNKANAASERMTVAD